MSALLPYPDALWLRMMLDRIHALCFHALILVNIVNRHGTVVLRT